MRLALWAAIPISEFWDLTPYIFRQLTAEAVEMRGVANRMMVTQAWLTASLSRAKTLPPLRRILNDVSPQKAEADVAGDKFKDWLLMRDQRRRNSQKADHDGK